MDKTLIVIPARKGSQRLPGKNMLPFAGQPLIGWTIKVALESEVACDVVVSTDCDETASFSKSMGAQVPFLRPKHLATNAARNIEVVIHAIDSLKALGLNYDYVVALQPTSPLRQTQHIRDSVDILKNGKACAVVSVTQVTHPAEWSMVLPENNSLDEFVNQQLSFLRNRSQELVQRYRINGAIYAARVERLFEEKAFLMQRGTRAYKMEKKFSADIDDIDDFKYAESLMLSSDKHYF